jgi:predicted ATP-grasp superfamily ATP-dependent carboligase
MTNQVLIVGASTRAAAFSALRAGLKPRCIDNFADRDLGIVSPVVRVRSDDGVSGVEDAARDSSSEPWFYTGPLENHPDKVGRISRGHRLLGNSPEVLRAVGDPLRLADVLRRHGLPCPDVRGSPEGLPPDGTWLEKPVASGGGRLIRPLEQARVSLSEPTYFQKRIIGGSFSALFIANERGASLIGVTRQLIGAPGSLFAYRGSIGPATISEGLKTRLEFMGRVLASEFALVGLFGVDYILSEGEPSPVEVNPRYTASVEVLELALRRSLLAEHLRACDGELLAAKRSRASSAARPSSSVVGKAIIYASRSLVTPDIPIDDAWRDDVFAIPTAADVPWPETLIEAGQPVMTVFCTGTDTSRCEASLDRQVEQWRERLES